MLAPPGKIHGDEHILSVKKKNKKKKNNLIMTSGLMSA